jgi:flagellar motor switch protein FliM
MTQPTGAAVPSNEGIHDVRLQTVDTLPAVCSDVLTEIHRGLARTLRGAMSEHLEATVMVEPPEVAQQPYSQFLHSVETPVFSSLITSELLSAPMLVVVDHAFVSAVLDKLLGGPGAPITERWPTDVDISLFDRVISVLLASLQAAFRPLSSATFSAERTELSPHFLSIAAHDDPVITFRLESQLEETSIGGFSCCFPFGSLVDLVAALPGAAMPVLPQIEEAGIDLEEAPVTMTLSLRNTGVAIGDFMSLEVGDVVILDHWADEPAIASVGNVPVLGVELGQMQGHLAAVVTDWRET